MRHLLITHRNFHGKSSDTVRPAYNVIFGSIISQISQGSAYMYLDTFGHTFTHLHIVLTAHIFLNIGCQIISGNTDRIVRHNTSQWNNRNFGRTTTYIDNHISFGCFHINTDTDSSSHRFKNQINIPSSRMLSTVTYRTKLYFSATRGNSDYHTQRRRKETITHVHFLY